MVIKATEDTQTLQAFRDDLREPKVTFGRCCITGEWGKVIAVDLGDISIVTPDTDNGVEYDEKTKEVTFTIAKPKMFSNQATFSKEGLEKLISYMDSQENPIPSVTPELVYMWQVTYTDGSGLAQFGVDPTTFEVKEINSSCIDHSRIAQLSIVSNPDVEKSEGKPTYTFVKDTGKFYMSGKELDTMFNAEYIKDSEVIYARKVNMTFGSAMITNSLDRGIQTVHSSVLQLMGWKIGGLQGQGPGCIIAIDERGHWRPYEYLGD